MNSTKKKYSGVAIPMATPALRTGKVDAETMGKLAQVISQSGGIPFVLGTTGEALSIPRNEAAQLVSSVRDAVHGNGPIYVGISGINPSDTLQSAKDYADKGVSAGVVHLPYYYPLTNDQILSYYEEIASKSPIPVILYNIPATTKISIPLEIIETLSHHENIVGLKDSERDDERLKEACERWRDRMDFSFFVGWGAKLVEGTHLGADGLAPSTGNIVPKLCVDLFNAAVKGDQELATKHQEMHDKISTLYQGAGRTLGQSLATLKMILKHLGLGEGGMIPPLTMLDANEEEKVRIKVLEWIEAGHLERLGD